MAERFDRHVLNNGMVLLGERMEAVESAAFDFLIPAGAAEMPPGCCGAANIISDWIFRGAADKNSRQLSDALDGLGLSRHAGVGTSHISIGAAMQAEKLCEALKLYADVILQSRLESDEFEPAKKLAIDEVLAVKDDPRQNVMIELKKHFYPEPLGRSTIGSVEELEKLNPDKVREIIISAFREGLSNTIFSVAGKYDFEKIVKLMEELFDSGTRSSGAESRTEEDKSRRADAPGQSPGQKPDKYTHIRNEGAQVHIGLMCPTVRPADEQYYNTRMAISVLSGGMSGRLFTEVREKRGLCYAVTAKYHGLKERAGIMCYAGSVPEKAQQTLDVIIDQFRKLREDIKEEEIERAKAGLKSVSILQSESSSQRAGAIGRDYYMLGRVRSLEEIRGKIERTSRKSVLQFAGEQDMDNFTVVTIGPSETGISRDWV